MTVASMSIAISIVTAVNIYREHSILKSVKSGEKTLFCNLATGYQAINPDMIESFDFDFGWTFKNGSAKNCETK